MQVKGLSRQYSTIVRKLVRFGVALSVSWWPYAVKAMCSNFGDRLVSGAVSEPVGVLALVASSISPKGEGTGNALSGVGEAHIIYEARDSITLARKGALLVCMTVLNSRMSPFSIRVRGRQLAK